jgi:hypothetical protein
VSESYERLEQQFKEIVAKQAKPVAEVIAGGHGPLHAVVRWLRDPMPPGTLLMAAPAGTQEFCRFPDCKCPMDPGPAPDWCARGLPHAKRAHGVPASDDCRSCNGTGSGGMGVGCTDCLGTGVDPNAAPFCDKQAGGGARCDRQCIVCQQADEVAAAGVLAVDRVQRLMDACEGEVGGLALTRAAARRILAFVDGGTPALIAEAAKLGEEAVAGVEGTSK